MIFRITAQLSSQLRDCDELDEDLRRGLNSLIKAESHNAPIDQYAKMLSKMLLMKLLNYIYTSDKMARQERDEIEFLREQKSITIDDANQRLKCIEIGSGLNFEWLIGFTAVFATCHYIACFCNFRIVPGYPVLLQIEIILSSVKITM